MYSKIRSTPEDAMTPVGRWLLAGLAAGLMTSWAIEAQGPGAGRGAGGGRGRGAAVALPEGAGREEVQAACASCHGLNLITGASGFSRAAWQDLVGTMVRMPDPELRTVSDYLATH